MSEEKSRLYQKIGQGLLDRIVSGEFPVGSRLPTEKALCEEMDVSRTVVREAIIMLEIKGMVSVRKGSGIYVTSVAPEDAAVAAQQNNDLARKIVEDLDYNGPFEVLETRQHIECLIAELAAVNATAEDLEALDAIQIQASSDDKARDSKWDKEFHLQLARATGHPPFEQIIEFLWLNRVNNPFWQTLHQHIDSGDLNSWHSEHEEILAAIEARDPKRASVAMWMHMESTKNSLYRASSPMPEDEN